MPPRGRRPPQHQRGAGGRRQEQEEAIAEVKRHIDSVLKREGDVYNAVQGILGAVDKLTPITQASYRKFHELIASSIDNAMYILRGTGSRLEEAKGRLSVSLTQARILVEYQRARKQLDDYWAEILRHYTDTLHSIVSSARDETVLRESLERARLALDALATLAYLKKRR